MGILCLFVGGEDDIGHIRHYARPFVSGCIYAMAYTCALTAFAHAGVSFSNAALCGTAALTSFLWGKAVFLEASLNITLAMLGLFVVVLGIVLFSFVVPHERILAAAEEEEPDALDPLLKSSAPPEGLKADQEPASGESPEENAPGPREVSAARGYMALAVLAGVLGGSSMAPLHGLSKNQGLGFLCMYGTGMVVCSVVMMAVWLAWTSNIRSTHHQFDLSLKIVEFDLQNTLGPGIAQGALFGVANACTVIAMDSPLGLAVAQPFREGALLVAGLWGWACLGELQAEGAFQKFIMCSVVIIAGIAMLAIFGTDR